MEVYSKYFRRLVSGNATQIFSDAKEIDNGSYPILQEEMQKVLRDASQAPRIAETLDTSEGDVFKDFDLVKFIEHFRLDPIAECLLAAAFRSSNRQDLRQKGSFTNLNVISFTADKLR